MKYSRDKLIKIIPCHKTNFSAVKQEIWFERAYALGVSPGPAYKLPIIGNVKRLIADSLITVVFGNLSAFQPFWKADSAEPSGITSSTVVTLTKIPHTSHMAWAIFHHVTLYWGCGTLKLPNIKMLYAKNVHMKYFRGPQIVAVPLLTILTQVKTFFLLQIEWIYCKHCIPIQPQSWEITRNTWSSRMGTYCGANSCTPWKYIMLCKLPRILRVHRHCSGLEPA